MNLYSVSSLTTYNECAARYALKYVHGFSLDGKYRTLQDRGSCVHEGISAALRESVHTHNIDQLVSIAQEIARIYGFNNEVDQSVIEESQEILAFYLPLLGIGQTMTPYMYKREPLIEFDFKAEFTKYGVGMRGRIDAVVILDNKVTLLDWKVRSSSAKFYSDEEVMIDKQLYVYAGIMKYFYGVEIEQIAQVQISADLPGRLRLKKNCQPDSADSFDSRLSKTTSEVFNQDIQDYDEVVKQELMIKFFDKILPIDSFLHYSYVPMSRVSRVMHYMGLTGQRVEADTQHLPILNAYFCKTCPVMEECQRVYFND